MSTFLPEIGLTFNQFLIDADEPLLFHCGQRFLFPAVSAAVGKVVAIDKLRWITFSHVESDECGSMNEWLAASPNATAAHGRTGCNIWLNDTAIRPPRALGDGEVLDLGGKKVRRIDTPHLPHCWDAGLIYEEITGTLFCSDLFTHAGEGPALTDSDIVGPAIALERRLGFTPITLQTAPMVRKLAALKPHKLAVMHGSSYSGDVSSALEGLAGFYEEQLRAG